MTILLFSSKICWMFCFKDHCCDQRRSRSEVPEGAAWSKPGDNMFTFLFYPWVCIRTFTGFHTNSGFGFFSSKGSLFVMQHNVVTKHNMPWDIFEYEDICPGSVEAMIFCYLILNNYNFFLTHYFTSHCPHTVSYASCRKDTMKVVFALEKWMRYSAKVLWLLYLFEKKTPVFLVSSLTSLACSKHSHLILICIWVVTFPSYLSWSSWAVRDEQLRQEGILLGGYKPRALGCIRMKQALFSHCRCTMLLDATDLARKSHELAPEPWDTWPASWTFSARVFKLNDLFTVICIPLRHFPGAVSLILLLIWLVSIVTLICRV